MLVEDRVSGGGVGQAREADEPPHDEATLEAAYDGIRTADIGGTANTDAFTNEVIRRVRAKLEVWAALA